MISQKRKMDYKWVIFGCCFLMTFVCLGFCSGNKGLYLTAMSDALGIKRSLFSINDSCRHVATGIINIFLGTILYRFGIRKAVALGFAALIASSLIYACAENIWMLYLGGTLLGVGLAFTTTTIASSLIRRWFQKNIGKYTGIVFAANGIGGAVAAQIVSPMINEEGNPFGYRTSYLVIAGILLITGILVVALLRERPKNETFTLDNTQQKKSRGVTWSGFDYQAAKHRPFFYAAVGCVSLTGFILQGISGVYAAHMKDVGLRPEHVATIVSVFSLALTGSKILIGLLYDRRGLRTVLVVCQSATVLAFLAMVFLNDSLLGIALGVGFAILYALALPLETLVIPLIANDLFGAVSYDKILGILSAANYIGYAFGAPMMNLCYDSFGSYKPVFLVFSGLMIPIGIVFQFAIRSAYREQRKERSLEI